MTKYAIKLNNYLKRNYWLRTAIGTALAFCLLAIIINPVKCVYYELAPGNWFLNVQEARVTFTDKDNKVTSNIPQNKNGEFVLIREPRERISAYNVVRIFYLTANGARVFEREIPGNIEYEQTIARNISNVKPDQRPNEPGEYYFCQIISFKLGTIEKTGNFCTEPFTIIAPIE